MAYLVLARKYRPTTLADMVGQEHIVRTLQNAIAQQRVHHAFLFTGARGVGKTSMARIVARALNCEQGPTASPCGTCGMCLEILAGKSNDVLEIDGASNTGVDNVRELRENVRYLPGRGRYKLFIIDEVHMLSQAAFNALLKTLEEPPPHVKFVFATTEPHKIPITILSRCQRFDFRRVAVPVLTQHVQNILAKEGLTLGPAAVAAVVREAQGSVRDALSLLDQVLSYGGEGLTDEQVLEALGVVDRQTVFALADRILARDAMAVLAVVADVDRRGHELASLAALLAEHWRDVAVLKQIGADASHLDRSQGELDDLEAQAKQRSQGDLQRLFRHTLEVAEDVARSTMPRVSLEMGLLRLLEMAPVVDMTTLLTRLDALAAGGATPGVAAKPVPGAASPSDAGFRGAGPGVGTPSNVGPSGDAGLGNRSSSTGEPPRDGAGAGMAGQVGAEAAYQGNGPNSAGKLLLTGKVQRRAFRRPGARRGWRRLWHPAQTTKHGDISSMGAWPTAGGGVGVGAWSVGQFFPPRGGNCL